jgi:hypothetical protein
MERPVKRARVIRTAYEDEAELVFNMLKLYNGGKSVDLDPCYSVGNVWKGKFEGQPLPQPKRKGDIAPALPEVMNMDTTNLSAERDVSLSSVFFDPPFLPSGKLGTGLMSGRFSHFENIKALYEMYDKSMQAFYRVLKKGGMLFFKCQDIVNFNRQHFIHVWIVNKATELGFEVMDLFVLFKNKIPMMSSQWKNQVHARKNHCFYLVLKKK